jgi:hypothetical protein
MACKCSVILSDNGKGGNNRATVRCQLPEGHPGKHRRSFKKLGTHGKQGEVVIEWDVIIDDSEKPDRHDIGGQG